MKKRVLPSLFMMLVCMASLYAQSGVQEAWRQHYGAGLAASYEVATDLALDDAGNIYVTGYSTKPPFGVDYLTAKYNASGGEVWTVRYDGDANGDDEAVAIFVDAQGTVYVTGKSIGSGTADDYATIKYNSAGVEQWVARYNSPGNNFDDARALAVDGAGNVYVTGSAYLGGRYATVKYNSAGLQQWVAYYDGGSIFGNEAAALALDNAGSVYVTGRSGRLGATFDYGDYATLKYNSAGVQQWVARYNGPGNSDDEAAALAVDGAGNVYVTGTSDYATVTTVKYNSAGVEQWVARYDGALAAAIAVDGIGNVYVTVSEGDYATIKYNSAGVEQWVARYNGPDNFNDEAVALAVDGAGDVYVTGTSIGSGTAFDYATIKYNSAGVQQWVARYNGPDNRGDRAAALALDSAGNVYVTGRSSDVGSAYATVKYNSAGVQQWVARYHPSAGFHGATALAVDGAGNVYVTGTSDDNYATVKYNSSTGVEEWVARYNGPGNFNDEAVALAVDGAGNVYVTGRSGGDYATVKYNSAGVEEWVVRYNGPGNFNDFAVALTVDAAANVYVTGSSSGTTSNTGGLFNDTAWRIYATIKYIQSPVSVEEKDPVGPTAYFLSQNYPNPFNPSTTIRYAIPKTSYVRLKVFNLLGKEIATLVRGTQTAGEYKIQWHAGALPSGLYLVRLEADEFIETKKVLLLK